MKRTALAIVVSLAFVSCAMAQPTGRMMMRRPLVLPPAPLTFGDRIQLGEGHASSGLPRMVVSGRHVYVTWAAGEPRADVHFAGSSDSGRSFSAGVNLSTTSATSWWPVIAAGGSNVYVAWRDEFTIGGDIFFARSENNGAGFHPHVNLSDSPGRRSWPPEIAASGDSVYVVWREPVDGRDQIVLRASDDGGATFGPLVNVSETPAGQTSSSPAVAVVGPRVHVIWCKHSRSIVCRTSADEGATWGDSIVLSESAGNNASPRIAASGLRVCVGWPDSMGIEGGNEEALLAVSGDGGASFASPVNMSNSAARTRGVRVAAAGSNVYALWQEDVGGDEDILLRASTNGGASFRGAVNLSNNTEDCREPCIHAYGDNVHVAWLQRNGVRGIQFRSSPNKGSGFSGAVDITLNGTRGSASGARIVAHGSSVYAVWNDNGPVFRKGTKSTTRPPSTIMRRAPLPRPGTSKARKAPRPR